LKKIATDGLFEQGRWHRRRPFFIVRISPRLLAHDSISAIGPDSSVVSGHCSAPENLRTFALFGAF
jgi:hypothetical protein